MIEALAQAGPAPTLEQGAVAALAIFGISTLLWLKGLSAKVEGAASAKEVSDIKARLEAVAQRAEVADLQEDVDGLGLKANGHADRLTKLETLLEAQTHRIDEHARGNYLVAKNYRELVDDLAAENRMLKEKR